MKIKFTDLPTSGGKIQVSFDGGKKLSEYNVEEIRKSGIVLSDKQDFSLIQIKSESTLLSNLEVLKTIKLVGQQGTSSGDLNNYFILDSSMAHLNVLSPGVILPYGGIVAPIGWHLCNGSTDEREDYPRLIAWAVENDVIGPDKLLGDGDGSTTFSFPDLRECGAEHIRDGNAAINLKQNAIKQVGQGVSEFRSVEGVEGLATLALQIGASDEAENLTGDGQNVLTL